MSDGATTTTGESQSLRRLKAELGDSVLGIDTWRGETRVRIEPQALLPACELLKQSGFNLLMGLTAADHWPKSPRFRLVYEMYSVGRDDLIELSIDLPEEAAEVPSIESIYPSANWHEREVYDMFGVTFAGHSDLRRILMPHDWAGHPLRRDYPLGYEEVQFSFNFDEIERRKKYAKD